MNIRYQITSSQHFGYAPALCLAYEESAKSRGIGIARRQVDYIKSKMQKGQAIIALDQMTLAGFCYIESWEHEKYVANSGLIVMEAYRQAGIARNIKKRAFELARNCFPQAQVFGITTSAAVMKINSELGYRPVSFAELTQDDAFWKGCQSCTNYPILQKNNRRLCLCTAMLAPSLEQTMSVDLSDQILTSPTNHPLKRQSYEK